MSYKSVWSCQDLNVDKTAIVYIPFSTVRKGLVRETT